jgi:hypothetical protein
MSKVTDVVQKRERWSHTSAEDENNIAEKPLFKLASVEDD